MHRASWPARLCMWRSRRSPMPRGHRGGSTTRHRLPQMRRPRRLPLPHLPLRLPRHPRRAALRRCSERSKTRCPRRRPRIRPRFPRRRPRLRLRHSRDRVPRRASLRRCFRPEDLLPRCRRRRLLPRHLQRRARSRRCFPVWARRPRSTGSRMTRSNRFSSRQRRSMSRCDLPRRPRLPRRADSRN